MPNGTLTDRRLHQQRLRACWTDFYILAWVEALQQVKRQVFSVTHMCISSFAIKLGTGLKRHTEKHVCASPKRILFESAVGRTNNVTQERTARCKQGKYALHAEMALLIPHICPAEQVRCVLSVLEMA